MNPVSHHWGVVSSKHVGFIHYALSIVVAMLLAVMLPAWICVAGGKELEGSIDNFCDVCSWFDRML